MPIACHSCPDHNLVDDNKVRNYRWNGGPAIKDEAKGVLHIEPSVTTEPVPGSFPVCPECLAKLLKGEWPLDFA